MFSLAAAEHNIAFSSILSNSSANNSFCISRSFILQIQKPNGSIFDHQSSNEQSIRQCKGAISDLSAKRCTFDTGLTKKVTSNLRDTRRKYQTRETAGISTAYLRASHRLWRKPGDLHSIACSVTPEPTYRSDPCLCDKRHSHPEALQILRCGFRKLLPTTAIAWSLLGETIQPTAAESIPQSPLIPSRNRLVRFFIRVHFHNATW